MTKPRIIAKTVAAPTSELVTVPNVPMISTGIDYPTSTGLLTFTEDHLRDLVASQDDPAIHAPRTKIGHSDPRFNETSEFDGEPSLGTWTNLRLTDNDQTVVGDIVGVPKWFASIVSTAYPSRSVEGNFDVETVTGHKWSLSVDAVAMLGVVGPGVTTLDDLPLLFSEEGPGEVKVIEAEEGSAGSVIRVTLDGKEIASAISKPGVQAEVVSDDAWSNYPNSEFDDEQYARACIYDRNKCSSDWSDSPAKQRYSLPVREPDGTINRNACHNAAGRIGQVSGGCDAAQKAAATTLVNIYKNSLKEDPPEGLQTLAAKKVKVPKGAKAKATAKKITAQVNLDDVRRQYYDSLGQGHNWWWIRAIYFDPNELIVDDDEGGLYRVGFDTKEDGITFAEPVPVKIQYIDQPVKSKVAAAIRASFAASNGSNGKEPRAQYLIRADSVKGVDGWERKGGSNVMKLSAEQIAELRSEHGWTAEQLPDDADFSTATELIQASADPPTASSQKEGEEEKNGETEGITSTEEAGRIPVSSAVNLPEGTIVVDKATWDEVAGQARQGAELAAKTRDTERDEFLNGAIKAGKFPPSRKDHYLNAWKADPEGTRGLIESLAPGLVPVEARGTAGTGKNETVESGVMAEAYDPAWLSVDERYRIKSAAGIQSGDVAQPRVIQGGD